MVSTQFSHEISAENKKSSNQYSRMKEKAICKRTKYIRGIT